MKTQTIEVSIPHRLTRQEALSRIQSGSAKLQSQFGGSVGQIEEKWTDYHSDFKFSAMGQSITGQMDVEDTAVRIAVDVPWMLAMIADKIKGRIADEGRKLLEKKP